MLKGSLFFIGFIAMMQSSVQVQPEQFTVLAITTEAVYQQPGASIEQALFAGAQLQAGTQIQSHQDSNGFIQVWCPSLVSESYTNTQLRSGVEPCQQGEAILGVQNGLLQLSRNRGAQGDEPYVLSPRSSVVREAQPTLIWNAPPNTDKYHLTIYSGQEQRFPLNGTYASYDAQSVEMGNGTARLEMPIEMQPEVAYSVHICAIQKNSPDEICTHDPVTFDPSFYYVALPSLEQQMMRITANLNPGQANYATAVAMSKPVWQSPAGDWFNAYSEAIDLLRLPETVQTFGHSPEYFVLLGELYEQVHLNEPAANAYFQALVLAEENNASTSIVAARALLGLARNSHEQVESVDAAQSAIEIYRQILSVDADTEAFIEELCASLDPMTNSIQACN